MASEPAPFAVWPSVDSPLSIVTSLREFVALAECLASPPPFPNDAARGKSEPVIVLPGFCAPNVATARLRKFLAHQGFAAVPWNFGLNMGPTKATLTALEKQMAAMANQYGRRVSLVGLSLGGTMAREMAKRRPELVAAVVTLASPIRLPVPTTLAPLVRLASALWEEDARIALARIAEPPSMPLTAIVTRDDGLVDWRACMPSPAPNVTVVTIAGAHVTIGSNPAAQRAVAASLAAL